MVELGICRIRINQEIRELYKDADLVAGIEEKRLEWIGHVARMDRGRTVKKIFDSKTEGSIKRGRPKLRYLEDVEKDLREMNVNRWREKAVDME